MFLLLWSLGSLVIKPTRLFGRLRYSNSHRIEAQGFSGGIWILWSDRVRVKILHNHCQFLHTHIEFIDAPALSFFRQSTAARRLVSAASSGKIFLFLPLQTIPRGYWLGISMPLPVMANDPVVGVAPLMAAQLLNHLYLSMALLIWVSTGPNSHGAEASH